MPHRASAKKTLRQNQARRLRNKTMSSRLRTEQNKFDRMLERGDVQSAEAQLNVLTKLYHRAASRRIVHPNLAARRQSRFQKRLNEVRANSTGF